MKVRISIHFAWWVPLYINALTFVAWITGMEPDVDMAVAVCMRGAKIKTKAIGEGE